VKTQPLITAVLGVLVVVLLVQNWRTSAKLDRLAEERGSVLPANAGAGGNPRNEDPAIGSPFSRRETSTPNGDDLAAANERIAALENDLAEVVDSLNTAIDRINRMTADARRAQQPSWGVGQAVGEPDTMTAGDHGTAWAPATADGGTEWLQLTYEKPVEVAQVRVRETCGAGAVAKVVAVLDGGVERVIWEGRESAGEGIVDAPFNAPPGIVARGVKVYLDTARVPGWNEIDAVELIGRDGTRQWAQSASASSSYGSGAGTLRTETLTRGIRVYDAGSVTTTELETVDSLSIQR
jgi:hypothetical protein